MELPIVIVDDGQDIEIYMTASDAEACLEAIDVTNNIYTGFDSSGRLLRLTGEKNCVKVTVAEEHPNHKEELKSALLRYLRLVGREPAIENTIHQLIEQCPERIIIPHKSVFTRWMVGIRRLFD